jgi:hypothetical protein
MAWRNNGISIALKTQLTAVHDHCDLLLVYAGQSTVIGIYKMVDFFY